VDRTLSRNLHRLTGRLDLAADRLLRAEADISYSRFLALYMVGFEGADTQRALAARLGVSEPSVSRMVRVLADGKWLESGFDPAGGNRKQLRLTHAGEQLLHQWGVTLEERLAAVLQSAGVSYRSYLAQTERLLALLDGERVAIQPRRPQLRRPKPA
jgi:DNA-binding MarR family transcriptional regulator